MASKCFGSESFLAAIADWNSRDQLPFATTEPRARCAKVCWRKMLLAGPKLERASRRVLATKRDVDVVLVTHFSARCFPSEGAVYRDPYWQPLLDLLDARGLTWIVVGRTYADERYVKEGLLRCAAQGLAVVPIELFLGYGDPIRTARAIRGFRPVWPQETKLGGRDLVPLLKAQWLRERSGLSLFQDLLHLRSWQRMTHELSPKLLLWPWENHSWEKSLIRSVRRADTGTILVGYQHSTLCPSLVNHFPDAKEVAIAPYPDRLVTTGQPPRELLLSYGHFPDDCVRPGCAIRYQSMYADEPTPRVKPDRIRCVGAALSFDIGESRRMVAVLSELASAKSIEVRLRIHPTFTSEALFGTADPPTGLVVDDSDSAGSFLEVIDCLCFTDTTMAFEALYSGVPIIRVGVGREAAADRLLDCPGLKRNIEDAKELVESLEMFESMSEEVFCFEQQSARAFVESYLINPTDAAMSRSFPELFEDIATV